MLQIGLQAANVVSLSDTAFRSPAAAAFAGTSLPRHSPDKSAMA
jgi:hypothetical protein